MSSANRLALVAPPKARRGKPPTAAKRAASLSTPGRRSASSSRSLTNPVPRMRHAAAGPTRHDRRSGSSVTAVPAAHSDEGRGLKALSESIRDRGQTSGSVGPQGSISVHQRGEVHNTPRGPSAVVPRKLSAVKKLTAEVAVVRICKWLRLVRLRRVLLRSSAEDTMDWIAVLRQHVQAEHESHRQRIREAKETLARFFQRIGKRFREAKEAGAAAQRVDDVVQIQEWLRSMTSQWIMRLLEELHKDRAARVIQRGWQQCPAYHVWRQVADVRVALALLARREAVERRELERRRLLLYVAQCQEWRCKFARGTQGLVEQRAAAFREWVDAHRMQARSTIDSASRLERWVDLMRARLMGTEGRLTALQMMIMIRESKLQPFEQRHSVTPAALRPAGHSTSSMMLSVTSDPPAQLARPSQCRAAVGRPVTPMLRCMPSLGPQRVLRSELHLLHSMQHSGRVTGTSLPHSAVGGPGTVSSSLRASMLQPDLGSRTTTGFALGASGLFLGPTWAPLLDLAAATPEHATLKQRCPVPAASAAATASQVAKGAASSPFAVMDRALQQLVGCFFKESRGARAEAPPCNHESALGSTSLRRVVVELERLMLRERSRRLKSVAMEALHRRAIEEKWRGDLACVASLWTAFTTIEAPVAPCGYTDDEVSQEVSQM